MKTGCGTYLFVMTWVAGIIFSLGGFIVQPRSQAPAFFAIGILCLIAAGIWTHYIKNVAPKRAAQEKERVAQEKKQKKLSEQAHLENKQKTLAHMEGLEKYHKMDVDEAREYQEGIAAMRQLGVIVQNSVYQEKESDWAVLGGIADGIAGPAAGIATAVNVMQDNARIRAENAERRDWGARQNAHMQELANQAAQKSKNALTMSQLERKYAADLSWSPSTLLSFLTIERSQAEVDSETGAVTVEVSWRQYDPKICIDGALRAVLYTDQDKCAGCAYLVFPKNGTASLKGTLSGICAYPKASDSYTVRIEPFNLWELAPAKKTSRRKTDKLTDEMHRKLVAEYEAKFQSELHAK